MKAAAGQWASHDPDPATAAQLRALAADPEAAAELADSFAATLQFGTAGLRAAMGPGPNRMNRVVVRRAAAGLAAHLLNLAQGNGTESPYVPRAVVGFDARHNSDIFAQETAAIFTAAGIQTFLMPSALPTPVLAYAVRALHCEAGVMVTASHNPPADNGYKVYLGSRAVAPEANGVQIVAPHDALIASAIDAVSATPDAGDTSAIPLATSGWSVIGKDLTEDYIRAVSQLRDPAAFPERQLRIVHTSMHGVGHETALAVLHMAGFTDIHAVPEQSAPNPDFPTVSFPNPEEPGAMDLSFALAHAVGADVVLANDPDADRAAVGALDPSTGLWRKLHGDEVGALLGAHLATRLGKAGHSTTDTATVPPVFANSIVSSRLLAKIAASAGFNHVQTLTGFKWISRVPNLSYGYEEALGYCVAPDLVRDKDGISAGLLIAEMAADQKAQGLTLFDALDDLAMAHGLHASDQMSVRVTSLPTLETLMAGLRRNPPTEFAGSTVVQFTDLSEGTPELPATDGLLFLTEDATRVIVRPSGTEPKLKCYVEVLVPVADRKALTAAKATAQKALAAVAHDLKVALGIDA
ncbi:phospho-sugar mutase [Arthrobacter sp. GMC3]|uniref:phospho-sugar mutase n=1 Tax=Arthrobacter sp. GMC3 TaxID=2058894 RepID=UPI0021580E4C|nr:phospho-sugar mutase [Arthrobacter sp. GMC3]